MLKLAEMKRHYLKTPSDAQTRGSVIAATCAGNAVVKPNISSESKRLAMIVR